MKPTSKTRRSTRIAAAMVALVLAAGCCEDREDRKDPVARITLLQLNDVYEIAPLPGSDLGGLARVATIRQRLLRQNPNTFTLLAGDFLSPSAIGALDIDHETVDGRHMLQVLNRVKVDAATLGNHEFDLKPQPLASRLGDPANRIQWLSANVRRSDKSPFAKVLPRTVMEAKAPNGRVVRVGIFGLTIETPKKDGYVAYECPLDVAKREVERLRQDGADVVIAMTHLSIGEDREIAAQVKGIDLIIGGHEHVSTLERAGGLSIAKADSNARSVMVHQVRYDTRRRVATIASTLQEVDRRIPPQHDVDSLVRSWQRKARAALKAMGYDSDKAVGRTPETLDGTEASVRGPGSNLTRLVADGMLASVARSDLAMFNSGSIRLDDVLAPGPLTQWDAFRVLPYKGTLHTLRASGAVLRKVLDENAARRRGDGHLLQFSAALGWDPDRAAWLMQGQPVDDSRSYRIVVNDYVWGKKDVYAALAQAKHEGDTGIGVQRSLVDAFARLTPEAARVQPARLPTSPPAVTAPKSPACTGS